MKETTTAPETEQVISLLGGDLRLIANPYPIWNGLRDKAPACRVGETIILSRYADVKRLVGDNNVLYSRAKNRWSRPYQILRENVSPTDQGLLDEVMANEFRQLVRLDPPNHARVRRTVQPAFSTRRLVSEVEEVVRTRVDEELNRAARGGAVADFKGVAFTIPLHVLGDLLGIPLEDLPQVHAWSERIAANKLNSTSTLAAGEAATAYRGLNSYIEALIDRQAVSGATGLVGLLLEEEQSGGLTHEDVMGTLALLIFAGHETSTNLLAIGLLALLRKREQWDRLCAEPKLSTSAVEELLRFVTPVHLVQQVAVQPHNVGEIEISEGDAVMAIIAAANRDPATFERPDTLDIGRVNASSHLALGFGAHFCLGAAVARMEGRLVFETLTQQWPATELEPSEIRWSGSASIRTPVALPVSFRR